MQPQILLTLIGLAAAMPAMPPPSDDPPNTLRVSQKDAKKIKEWINDRLKNPKEGNKEVSPSEWQVAKKPAPAQQAEESIDPELLQTLEQQVREKYGGMIKELEKGQAPEKAKKPVPGLTNPPEQAKKADKSKTAVKATVVQKDSTKPADDPINQKDLTKSAEAVVDQTKGQAMRVGQGGALEIQPLDIQQEIRGGPKKGQL